MLARVSAYMLKITMVTRKEPGGNNKAPFPEQLSLSPGLSFCADSQTLLPPQPRCLSRCGQEFTLRFLLVCSRGACGLASSGLSQFLFLMLLHFPALGFPRHGLSSASSPPKLPDCKHKYLRAAHPQRAQAG